MIFFWKQIFLCNENGLKLANIPVVYLFLFIKFFMVVNKHDYGHFIFLWK